MPNVRLPLVALPLVGILVAACSAAPAPSSTPPSTAPSASPAGSPADSPSPSASPIAGEVDHPTGATDVILRLDEGGGFVMPAFAATQAPIFTLYGDGTVVFRPLPPDAAPPAEGGVIKENAFHTAKLTPEQVDQLLVFALRDGGLGLASRDHYENPMVADASTATFTVRADGLDRTISAYALGFDPPEVPAFQERQAFARLAERLRAFDQSVPTESQPYQPTAYRGILLDAAGVPDAKPLDWPWPDVDVTDFKPRPGDEGLSLPVRTMTPAEIAATGVTGGEGGFQNLFLEAPDGTTIAFAARPLLPDETG